MLICSGKAQDHRPSIGSLQKHLQFSTCPNDLLHKVLHGATEQQGFFRSIAHQICQATVSYTMEEAPLLSSPVQPFLQQCCQDHQMSDTAVALETHASGAALR